MLEPVIILLLTLRHFLLCACYYVWHCNDRSSLYQPHKDSCGHKFSDRPTSV